MSDPKRPPAQKPTISPENHDQNVGQRGGAEPAKQHGDDLSEAVPRTPMQKPDKPGRDTSR